jgi:hypothetical protein
MSASSLPPRQSIHTTLEISGVVVAGFAVIALGIGLFTAQSSDQLWSTPITGFTILAPLSVILIKGGITRSTGWTLALGLASGSCGAALVFLPFFIEIANFGPQPVLPLVLLTVVTGLLAAAAEAAP